VTNKSNGRSVTVRINDRGPFVRGRVIDLTPAAAHAVGFSGLARVLLQARLIRKLVKQEGPRHSMRGLNC
jgi:rare lipoprotein A